MFAFLVVIPRREFASAGAFLVVIPEGNLLLPLLLSFVCVAEGPAVNAENPFGPDGIDLLFVRLTLIAASEGVTALMHHPKKQSSERTASRVAAATRSCSK